MERSLTGGGRRVVGEPDTFEHQWRVEVKGFSELQARLQIAGCIGWLSRLFHPVRRAWRGCQSRDQNVPRFMREPGISEWILAETATCWFEMQHVLQGKQETRENGKMGVKCVGRDAKEDGIAGKNQTSD
jgi:hypothetical protein